MTRYAIKNKDGYAQRDETVRVTRTQQPTAAIVFSSMTAALLFQETHQVEGDVVPVDVVLT